MSVISQLEEYQGRGFGKEQAQTIVLMRAAAIALFRDFPEHFVLFGGATLVLFHNSVRHSADLDLLATKMERPPTEAILDSLKQGLQDVSEILNVHPIRFEVEVAEIPELKIAIFGGAGQRLFRVDFNKLGSILDSEVRHQALSGALPSAEADIAVASKDLLLFQKAEAFLLRRTVKARDAYDIDALFREGAVLTQHLRDLLTDTLLGHEIEGEQIEERIQQLTSRRCNSELEPILPRQVYQKLKGSDFSDLHLALRALFAEWL